MSDLGSVLLLLYSSPCPVSEEGPVSWYMSEFHASHVAWNGAEAHDKSITIVDKKAKDGIQ